nr:ionic transporter y4hA [uncultured Sphingomonas sp.]
MTAISRYWPVALPLLGLLAILLTPVGIVAALIAIILIGVVIAAVHHAEVIAHKVGEPFGSLVLALAVTIIETGLIVTLMLDSGDAAATLARDTVFAAAMIILNLLIGLCLLLGGIRHKEQRFTLSGANAALSTIAILTVLTLVLPNFTTSVAGPIYSPFQLGFVAVISLVLYLTFLFVQTVRHRDYFLPAKDDPARSDDDHAQPPSAVTAWTSLGLLLVCLVAVVLLAKKLSPVIEAKVLGAGLPLALVGVIIAATVLMPEGLAAVRAARANRLQTSMNLALGSALATIGLTIPAVAVVSLTTGLPLSLGLNTAGITLLALTLFVASLSLQRGRTTVLQGALHLVLFAAYLLVTIVP